MSKSKATRFQRGFTFVEIVIIAPIVILAIGAFVAAVVSMTSEVLRSRASNVLTYNVQDALNHIEQDIKLSSTFLSQSMVIGSGQQGQGYDDATARFYNVEPTTNPKGQMLILNALATTDNPISSTAQIAYQSNQPNACGATQNKNTPLSYNVVYYVKTVNSVSSLWRRTIMPAGYATATCNAVGSITPGIAAPWQRPSCTPEDDGVFNNAFCVTNDLRLVDGVSKDGFTITYYNTSSSTSANSAATTTVDPDVRQSALSSATTASVSIAASQSISGKNVEQSGSIRATRLDTNASSIITPPAASTPGTPAVTGNYTAPASATFSWPIPSGGGNITYSAEYQVDGTGGWLPALTNSPLRTFTVTPGNNHTVAVHVTASSSAGTSGQGTASVTVPQWVNIVLQNSWTDYESTYTTSAFTKTSSGLVMLKGLIKGGSVATNSVIFNLPVGYRPSAKIVFAVNAGNSYGRLAIDSNGDVSNYGSVGGSASYTSLDGISFIPSGSPYALNPLSPLPNSWVNYGSGFADLTYSSDGVQRVTIQGAVKNGTASSSLPLANLPNGSGSPIYSYYPVATYAGGMGFVIADPSNAIEYYAGGNTIMPINVHYFTSTKTTGSTCTTQWCTLPLTNSWVAYDSTRTPVYTKTSDDVVTIRGLGKSGTATPGTILATLPVGYRPDARRIFNSVCNSAFCRLDVLPDGTIRADAGVSNAWTSFDTIQFMIN